MRVDTDDGQVALRLRSVAVAPAVSAMPVDRVLVAAIAPGRHIVSRFALAQNGVPLRMAILLLSEN